MNAFGSRLDARGELVYLRGALQRIAFDPGARYSALLPCFKLTSSALFLFFDFGSRLCFNKAGACSIGSFGDNLEAACTWVCLMQRDADAV